MDLLFILNDIELLGNDIVEWDDFFELMLRFALNIGIIFILVRLIYYPITKRKDYLFTYILISVIVFLLCILLGNVKLQLGFALGLFAIFGIIRYRTNPIPIKEMTYLFMVIGISVINALANTKVSWAELVFTNAMVVIIAFALERIWLLRHESSKVILYEKIDLIKRENRAALMEDLEKRTGLNINRIEIGRIDFLRDTARIRIYYFEDDNKINLSDQEDYYSDINNNENDN